MIVRENNNNNQKQQKTNLIEMYTHTHTISTRTITSVEYKTKNFIQLFFVNQIQWHTCLIELVLFVTK